MIKQNVSISMFEMSWIYVIPAGIYLLKVRNLVTLEQGVGTIQS